MDALPKSEAVHRLGRIQEWMRHSSIDALFVLQNADLYYFAGTIQTGLLCLPAEGEPLYLVQRSPARARMESPWERIVPLRGLKQAPQALAAEGLAGVRRIGLELDVLPAAYYLRLVQLFPGIEFADASEGIRRVRMVKSPYEVQQMRGAAGMLREAFAHIPEWARAGATELDVAARLEGFLRACGHQGIVRARSFNFEIGYGTLSAGASAGHPICYPGPVGCLGLYPAVPNGASRRPLAAGETFMVDVVGGCGGYLADKTRTYAVGEIPAEMRRAHEFVLELLGEIEAMLQPGKPCSSVYEAVMERVGDSPYADGFMGAGENRVRFIGHGIGLELDELPVLAAGFDLPLEAGMTIAVEPKIFFPQGGVGVENTYLVTAAGAERLTVFPEELLTLPA